VHPVVLMPPVAVVLDLTVPGAHLAAPGALWTIGRYDEDRSIYTQPLFGGARTVHMGVDLGGPVGVAVHAPMPGVVTHAGALPAPGDYGHAVVVEHTLDGRPMWVLFGHLSARSIGHSPPGRRVRAGDVLGWLGHEGENGGWPSHVHVQLSWERPATHDMPGAVRPEERAAARARFPDPRRIVGPVY
jgi:peptidoglycan LD-endopeptidase LytH